ncbi:MAG: DUF2179 domain-containing protein [Planctomycetes bacterium]|nr:DUF2179 domain-containing protein [Planctomycetota bacterium]
MSAFELLLAGPVGPLVIFLLRVVDVSLDTVRILLTVRRARSLVPLIAFVQVLLWLVAVGTALKNLHSLWHVLGYAGGFAAGNLAGLWLEEKVGFGFATVRIISRENHHTLAEQLRALGFGVTEFNGKGRDGDVSLVYSVLLRRDVARFLAQVNLLDGKAFVCVEEPRSVLRGWLGPVQPIRK